MKQNHIDNIYKKDDRKNPGPHPNPITVILPWPASHAHSPKESDPKKCRKKIQNSDGSVFSCKKRFGSDASGRYDGTRTKIRDPQLSQKAPENNVIEHQHQKKRDNG